MGAKHPKSLVFYIFTVYLKKIQNKSKNVLWTNHFWKSMIDKTWFLILSEECLKNY